MILKDAAYWAHWKLERFALGHYSVVFYQQPTPLAWTCGRSIALSASFCLLNSMSAVWEVIEHEIGHALAPRGTGHGDTWKNIAFHRVGINGPKEYFDSDKLTPEFRRVLDEYRSNEDHINRGEHTHDLIATILAAEADEHKPGMKGSTDLRFINYGTLT